MLACSNSKSIDRIDAIVCAIMAAGIAARPVEDEPVLEVAAIGGLKRHRTGTRRYPLSDSHFNADALYGAYRGLSEQNAGVPADPARTLSVRATSLSNSQASAARRTRPGSASSASRM